jgi:hypothetical protein
MNINHLTIYFDQEHFDRDGKGFCVDHDPPDIDGQRQSGSIGFRFETVQQLCDHIAPHLQYLAAPHNNKKAKS